MQVEIDALEGKAYQQVLKAQAITKEAKAPSWSFSSILKKVFGFLFAISIINIIAFPKPSSIYPDTIESMDRVKVSWNRTESKLIAQ